MNPETLAALLSDPARAECLLPEELPEALGQVARLEAVLRQHLNQPLGNGSPSGVPPARIEPDRFLKAKEVAEILRKTPRYVYDHAKNWPFTKKIGPRGLLFSEKGLHRWLARLP